MKARSLYLLMAKEASTDSNDSMNSVIKIIDQFNVGRDEKTKNEQSLTVIPIPYSIASLWYFDEKVKKGKKYRVEFDTYDPSDIKISSAKTEYEVPFDTPKLSFNVHANGLPATTAGSYKVRGTLFDGSTKLATAEYPYELNIEWVKTEKA